MSAASRSIPEIPFLQPFEIGKYGQVVKISKGDDIGSRAPDIKKDRCRVRARRKSADASHFAAASPGSGFTVEPAMPSRKTMRPGTRFLLC